MKKQSRFSYMVCLSCSWGGLVHERNQGKDCHKCGGVRFVMIDPWESPVFSMLPKRNVDMILHDWRVDALVREA